MKTQSKIAALTFILFASAAFAQDTIIKRNNESVIGIITEVTPSEIRFNRYDVPDGPLYSINKKEISRIKYRNGMTDNFNLPLPSKTEATPLADTTPRYILIMTDGTQLKGKIIRQDNTHVVFMDNNFGEKKISRNKIKSLKLEHGEFERVFTLTDGTVITGIIINKNENETVIETKELGTITIPSGKIKSVRDRDEAVVMETGKIWFKNPNCTRYLFAPSAFQLKKGEGYYQNIYGAGNAVNFGINDHITIGGGIMGPFGAYINAKVGADLGEYVHVGGGAILGNGFFPVNGNNFGAGLGFAVITIGNYDHNITVGSGYGFINAGGTTGKLEKPLFVVNGMARVGKKFALVSENWIVNVKGDPFDRGINSSSHYETVFSYAFRYMGEKSTLDAGFLNTPGLINKGWYIGIPYIGFVIRFGNYKDQ